MIESLIGIKKPAQLINFIKATSTFIIETIPYYMIETFEDHIEVIAMNQYTIQRANLETTLIPVNIQHKKIKVDANEMVNIFWNQKSKVTLNIYDKIEQENKLYIDITTNNWLGNKGFKVTAQYYENNLNSDKYFDKTYAIPITINLNELKAVLKTIKPNESNSITFFVDPQNTDRYLMKCVSGEFVFQRAITDSVSTVNYHQADMFTQWESRYKQCN